MVARIGGNTFGAWCNLKWFYYYSKNKMNLTEKTSNNNPNNLKTN